MGSDISTEDISLDSADERRVLMRFAISLLRSLQKPLCDECASGSINHVHSSQIRSVEKVAKQLIADLEDQHTENGRNTRHPSFAKRIAVESGPHRRIVSLRDIEYISTSGSHLEIHIPEETLQMRERMRTMEVRLPEEHFFRIHRSYIVGLDHVNALINEPNGRCWVRLKGARDLPVSRARRASLEELLGLLP